MTSSSWSKPILFLAVFSKLAFAPLPAEEVCPLDQVQNPSSKLSLDLSLKTSQPPERLLVDTVEGLISVPQILRIERMLDRQGDGLGLTPTLPQSPKGETQKNLKQWISEVDEFFAGVEVNDRRRRDVESLFLDYVNNPPAGYLPGYESGPRSHHDSVASYFQSSYGKSEHEVAVRTLQNSLGFLEVVDSSKDDRQRLERAMKARSAYFMLKVLQWGHTEAHSRH